MSSNSQVVNAPKYTFSDLTDETLAELISPVVKAAYAEADFSCNHKYNLVITGSVGSGKSTRLQSLTYLLKQNDIAHCNYPEYLRAVDPIFAGQLLNEKMQGNVSTMTLQSFVLDSWETLLKNNKDNNANINIYERCVDDSVFCFSNFAHLVGDLTDIELLSLFNRMEAINKKHNLPSFTSSDRHFTMITSDDLNNNLLQILGIILEDLKAGITNRIIGLHTTVEESMRRIAVRNRSGEDKYSEKTITKYVNHYDKLFKFMIDGGSVKSILDLRQFM